MSSDFIFTKENLDICLRELGKEFRKLNGTAMKEELTLIGGAAILVNYCPPSRIDGQKETRYNGKEGRQRR